MLAEIETGFAHLVSAEDLEFPSIFEESGAEVNDQEHALDTNDEKEQISDEDSDVEMEETSMCKTAKNFLHKKIHVDRVLYQIPLQASSLSWQFLLSSSKIYFCP